MKFIRKNKSTELNVTKIRDDLNKLAKNKLNAVCITPDGVFTTAVPELISSEITQIENYIKDNDI